MFSFSITPTSHNDKSFPYFLYLWLNSPHIQQIPIVSATLHPPMSLLPRLGSDTSPRACNHHTASSAGALPPRGFQHAVPGPRGRLLVCSGSPPPCSGKRIPSFKIQKQSVSKALVLVHILQEADART